MKMVVFRHLPDDGYESAFETHTHHQGMIVREQFIPGLFGTKDIYIQHSNFWHRGEAFLLITYTNEEPTGEEIEIVISRARNMLDGRN